METMKITHGKMWKNGFEPSVIFGSEKKDPVFDYCASMLKQPKTLVFELSSEEA